MKPALHILLGSLCLAGLMLAADTKPNILVTLLHLMGQSNFRRGI